MSRFPFCTAIHFCIVAYAMSSTTLVTSAEKKDADPNTKHIHGVVSKVDEKNSSVTIKTSDHDGKGEEKTFQVSSSTKLKDDSGKTAKLDVFKTGDHVCATEKDGKIVSLKKHAEATITKVDEKAGTVTVKMKDKSGKDVEKTFTLVEESEYFDSNGRVAELDVFRSGDEILVIEADGKIQEMKKADDKKKTSTTGK